VPPVAGQAGALPDGFAASLLAGNTPVRMTGTPALPRRVSLGDKLSTPAHEVATRLTYFGKRGIDVRRSSRSPRHLRQQMFAPRLSSLIFTAFDTSANDWIPTMTAIPV
jgi:hypothetical protein